MSGTQLGANGVTVSALTGRKTVRAIHTSDVHLGYDFYGDGSQVGLRAVVNAALANNADVLLLAGDLFDHARVPDRLVGVLISELTRFGRTSIILPGNHDALDDRSVYRRPSFNENRPDNIHLLDLTHGDAGHWVFPDLELEVWGRPMVDHHPGFRPLAEVPARVLGGWRIVMAHGHYEEEGKPSGRSSPIHPEEIEAVDAEYIALGHWDRQLDISHGNVRAYYSGAPHTLGKATSAILLDLTDAGVSALPIDLTPYMDPADAE